MVYPRQFSCGSAANPVSKVPPVNPIPTMERAGEGGEGGRRWGELEAHGDTAQRDPSLVNRFVGRDLVWSPNTDRNILLCFARSA